MLMPSIHTVRKFCEMTDIVLKRTFGNTHPVWSAASVVALALLTGCGGVPEGYVDAETIDAYVEGVVVSKQRANYGIVNQPNAPSSQAINAGAISSSFTLKPTEDFRGFNHEMWNGPKSLTECSCGDNVREHPRTMSWNPA
jgi:hypothetical protein